MITGASVVLSSLALLAAAALLVFTLRRMVFIVAALFGARISDRPADPPSVALLVPARNEEANADALLEAIAALEYPRDRLDIVLVNDGSRDSTGDQFRAWASGRPRTIVVDLERSLGKFDALNHAIAVVPHVDVIAVCDADLRPRPEWLQQLVTAFTDDQVGAVAGLVFPENADNGLIARYAAVESWVHQLITSAAKDTLGIDPPTLGASAFRRAALEQVGGFPHGGSGGDLRVSAALTGAGWRTRFVAEAVVENRVVQRWSDYWHQHVRWARNVFASGRSRSRARKPRGLAARVEGWLSAAGYADRIVFLVVVIGAAFGLLPLWPAGVYIAVAGAEVGVAIAKAGVGARWPAFFLSTLALFPVDVAASLAATASHIARRPRSWRQPRRELPPKEPNAEPPG